jgi:hypothetical protein
MVAADARTAIIFALSPGHDHDTPHGRAFLEELGPMPEGLPLLMDRAYEGNETRQLVLDLGIYMQEVDKRIAAIKWLRDQVPGLSLKDAKYCVDDVNNGFLNLPAVYLADRYTSHTEIALDLMRHVLAFLKGNTPLRPITPKPEPEPQGQDI